MVNGDGVFARRRNNQTIIFGFGGGLEVEVED
jgi:hypothetical protein